MVLVNGKNCIKAEGTKKCTKDGNECDVANGFVCMNLTRASSDSVKTLCGEPQEEGCWCDQLLTSQEACREGLSCQENNHGHLKCRPAEIPNAQCSASECAWRMMVHHAADGTVLDGSLDTLFEEVKNGAEVKVWTGVYGLVNVQKLSVAYNDDIGGECLHGQSLFWASGGRGRVYNLYMVFSTSGITHITQFFVNDPDNKGRINSNILLEMKWFTRKPALKVEEESVLLRGIRDGSHIRVAVDNSFRHVEVVDLSADEIAAMSVYELEDINNGMEFYPEETRLLRYWTYTGHIKEASGLLNQPSWSLTGELHGQNIDWFVDPCWRAVYRHSLSGVPLFGSKGNLLNGLESGQRVKLMIEQKFYEANVIQQADGEVTATVFDSVDADVTKGQWEWLIVETTGKVNIVRFVIGGDELLSEDRTYAEVTWFLENKEWSSVTPAELGDKVDAGADVRYSVQSGNETKWYQADYAQKVFDDGVRPPRLMYLLYNERELVHDGTNYLQRYSLVNWNLGTFTYMDYHIGKMPQVNYGEMAASDVQINFFTNAVTV